MCQICYYYMYVIVIWFFIKIIINLSLLNFYRIYGNLAFAFLPMFQIMHARVLRWSCVSKYVHIIMSCDLIRKPATCAYVLSTKSFNIKLWILKLIQTESTWYSIEMLYKCTYITVSFAMTQNLDYPKDVIDIMQIFEPLHQNYFEVITYMFHVVKFKTC